MSLILPADAAWTETNAPARKAIRPKALAPAPCAVDEVAVAVRGASKPAVLLGGGACGADALRQASRLQAAGIRVFVDTFVGRQPRGAGVFAPSRMPYYAEAALEELAGVDLLVLVSTAPPVAFFAYPDRPNVLVPEGCRTIVLAERSEDAKAGLQQLAEALDAPKTGAVAALSRPDAAPVGKLTSRTCGASIARHLPEGAVICDDSVTSGAGVTPPCMTAAPHEVLALTGGAIGIAMPLAIGAAVACPDRKVVALSGDGSAMYTLQSLWTIAREQLDVTVVVFANHSYRVLNIEMERTGAGVAGASASKLLDLGEPRIEWVKLVEGLGVEAVRCETAEAFEAAFARAMQTKGPVFIEAALS